MPTRLIEIVDQLPASRIVLVGDLMMDRYLYGNAERLSPEAPVPVLHYRREELRLGGAGGVAANLAALGAKVDVVGVVGNDETAKQLREHLRECGCSTDRLVEDPTRPTTCKVRLVGLAQHRHPQQMMRLDFEEHAALSADVREKIIAQVEAALDGAAMLCIEDYNKGLLHGDVCPRLIQIARSRGVPVIIDPANIPDFSKYAGATALKLNRTETQKSTGLPVGDETQFAAAAKWLVERIGLEAVVLTLDKLMGAYLKPRANGQGKVAQDPPAAGVRCHRRGRHGAGDARAGTRASGAHGSESVAAWRM